MTLLCLCVCVWRDKAATEDEETTKRVGNPGWRPRPRKSAFALVVVLTGGWLVGLSLPTTQVDSILPEVILSPLPSAIKVGQDEK